jgi:hypothetical protein
VSSSAQLGDDVGLSGCLRDGERGVRGGLIVGVLGGGGAGAARVVDVQPRGGDVGRDGARLEQNGCSRSRSAARWASANSTA